MFVSLSSLFSLCAMLKLIDSETSIFYFLRDPLKYVDNLGDSFLYTTTLEDRLKKYAFEHLTLYMEMQIWFFVCFIVVSQVLFLCG
jgi:hypothetical protein